MVSLLLGAGGPLRAEPLHLAASSEGSAALYLASLPVALTQQLAKTAPGHPTVVRVTTAWLRRNASPHWDLALLDPVTLNSWCKAGRLVRLAPGAILSTRLSSQDAGCGADAYRRSTALTWDPGKVPGTPTWMDFWNVARIPGKRGLQRTPVGTLEIALLADGVAPQDIYRVLRAPGGVDRAFRKLDQLRPYVAWWRNDADPVALLTSARVVMSSAPAELLDAASHGMHHRFEAQPAGRLVWMESWAINAASASKASAMALMTAATRAEPVPSLPSQTLSLDAAFWRDHEAELNLRFVSWIRS